MGIGVSYTGTNGNTSSFGGFDAKDALRQIQSIHSQAVSSISRGGGPSATGISNDEYHRLKAAREAERNAKKASKDMFGKAFARLTPAERREINRRLGIGDGGAEVKVERFGSIEKNANGELRLAGDGKVGRKSTMYGLDANGVRGFHTLDAIDPSGNGVVIGGKARTKADPSNDERKEGDAKPFSEKYVGDLFADEEPVTGNIVLYQFSRQRNMTAGGREKSVSGEERKIVAILPKAGGSETTPDGISVENKEIYIGDDDEGDPEYAVRRQIKGFDSGSPSEETSLADRLAQDSTYEAFAIVRIVERDDEGVPSVRLAYMPLGFGLSKDKYVKGDYTNIEFTPVAQGSHTYKVDVFYS